MSIKVFYRCTNVRCDYIFEAAISAKNWIIHVCPRCRFPAKFFANDLGDDV